MAQLAKYMSSIRGAIIGALGAVPLVLAVSDLHLHKYQAARHRGPEEEQSGKPTVVNGEHLDPYEVPEELIGLVGLNGPRGDRGQKGVQGADGPMGKNLTDTHVQQEGPLLSTSSVTRGMVLDLFLFNAICLGIMHWQLKKKIQHADAPEGAKGAAAAGAQAVEDTSYITISFGIANVMWPPLEEGGHVAAFEELVKNSLAQAAVAGGAQGVMADNVAVALGGDDDSTLVSATMGPPEGLTSVVLKQALDKRQLQVILPAAVDAAAGVETFKKGPVTVADFEAQIEQPAPEAPEAAEGEAAGPVTDL